MAKRNFATLMFVSIAVLALGNNPRAQMSFTGTDGCAVLADIVHAEVTAAAWYGPGAYATMLEDAGKSQITVCNQTTRTVSKAFASAMTNIGEPVRWGYPGIEPGDVCLSIFLDQCYPDRSRVGGATGTWNVVSKTVKQAMPNGVATDQSIFASTTMRLALRSALDRQRE